MFGCFETFELSEKDVERGEEEMTGNRFYPPPVCRVEETEQRVPKGWV